MRRRPFAARVRVLDLGRYFYSWGAGRRVGAREQCYALWHALHCFAGECAPCGQSVTRAAAMAEAPEAGKLDVKPYRVGETGR